MCDEREESKYPPECAPSQITNRLVQPFCSFLSEPAYQLVARRSRSFPIIHPSFIGCCINLIDLLTKQHVQGLLEVISIGVKGRDDKIAREAHGAELYSQSL